MLAKIKFQNNSPLKKKKVFNIFSNTSGLNVVSTNSFTLTSTGKSEMSNKSTRCHGVMDSTTGARDYNAPRLSSS